MSGGVSNITRQKGRFWCKNIENKIILDYDFLKSILKKYYQRVDPSLTVEVNLHFKKYHRCGIRWDDADECYDVEKLVCDVYTSYKTVVLGNNTTIKEHILLEERDLKSLLKDLLDVRLECYSPKLEVDYISARKKDARILLSPKKTSKQKRKNNVER